MLSEPNPNANEVAIELLPGAYNVHTDFSDTAEVHDHLTEVKEATRITPKKQGVSIITASSVQSCRLTHYPGGKNANGVFHQIINRIPFHLKCGELCLGSGAISERLLPAPLLIVNDKDIEVLRPWRNKPGVIVRNEDVLDLLFEFLHDDETTFLYSDPPYPFSVRSGRKIYKYEWNELEHQIFLSRVLPLKCRVMISSYRNSLYDEALKGWIRHEYNSGTRGGLRVESLYMNYDPAQCILHDYRYYGNGWKHWEHLRLKVKRFTAKLRAMDEQERNAVLSGLLLDNSELVQKLFRS